jgi:hypothetical protein
MARYRVTCIHKRGSHFDPHERIAHIGSDEGKWKLSEDEAIRSLHIRTAEGLPDLIDLLVTKH